LARLHAEGIHGQVVSILRQELDSMVRVIYLLSIENRARRLALVDASVAGRIWTHENSRRRVTDRDMVEIAATLAGWTESVYRFGCAFIHLSAFHDCKERDPLQMISRLERDAIIRHMRRYHGGPVGDRPTFGDVVPFLPLVFSKIADNLECYVSRLETDGGVED
jgi:hypothetical protein